MTPELREQLALDAHRWPDGTFRQVVGDRDDLTPWLVEFLRGLADTLEQMDDERRDPRGDHELGAWFDNQWSFRHVLQRLPTMRDKLLFAHAARELGFVAMVPEDSPLYDPATVRANVEIAGR